MGCPPAPPCSAPAIMRSNRRKRTRQARELLNPRGFAADGFRLAARRQDGSLDSRSEGGGVGWGGEGRLTRWCMRRLSPTGRAAAPCADTRNDLGDPHARHRRCLEPRELLPNPRGPRRPPAPENFFAESEQIAFGVGVLVDGLDFSDDKMLIGRTFAYSDTQRYRVGPNRLQLPVNHPKEDHPPLPPQASPRSPRPSAVLREPQAQRAGRVLDW